MGTHKSWFDAIKSKFPLKKVKAWPSCLGMIRARIASQKLEKMTSSTVEPMETHCASPNKTRVLLGTCARLHWCCLMSFFSLILNINVLHLISHFMVVEPYTVVWYWLCETTFYEREKTFLSSQVSYISVILQLIQCFISAVPKKLRSNLIRNED